MLCPVDTKYPLSLSQFNAFGLKIQKFLALLMRFWYYKLLIFLLRNIWNLLILLKDSLSLLTLLSLRAAVLI